ncbi:MAG: hypothetical protein ACOYUZ_05955 [Patescibacteria group bacterium]
MAAERAYQCREIRCGKRIIETDFCMICERCPDHCTCSWQKVVEEDEEDDLLELDVDFCKSCNQGFEIFELCEICRKCPNCCKHKTQPR